MEKKTAQKNNEAKVQRKTLTGIVISDKMKDTIVVRVGRFVKNEKYQKYVTSHKKYKVHDAGNTKKIGDKVTIESCRPMSKDKSFKVIA
ncbi:MAG: 30S ribosomal protein S17 [Patescibacteria group bacterium]